MARTSAARNEQSLDDLLKGTNLIDQFTSSLIYSRPWDSIIDFATHPSFCGISLYPRQETLLKLIYLETENMTAYDIDVINEWAEGFKNPTAPAGVQPDIWDRVKYLKDRGYTHFPHVQAVLGRRASKGMIGGICGAERMAYMVSLDDPQKHFGVARGKDLWLSCLATTGVQAQKFLFADVRQAVEDCGYLQDKISTSKEYTITLRTAADTRRIADMKARGVPMDREIASVRAVAMSSNSASGRGGSGICNMYDEMAFMLNGTGGPRTAELVYDSYQPSLDQFGKAAFTYIPSSPFSKVGKFFELYKAGSVLLEPDQMIEKHDGEMLTGLVDQEDVAEELKKFEDNLYADPEMLVVQLPSWDLYRDWQRGEELVGRKFRGAIQYEPLENGVPENERMVRIERRDPAAFRVERRAQFAEVVAGYLDPAKVDQIFEPFDDGRVLTEQANGKHNIRYHCHIDPSATNANFAISIGHVEEIPGEKFGNESLHRVIIDYMHVYKPSEFPDHTIDYLSVIKDLKQLMTRFKTIELLTFDQWNSVMAIAELRKFAADNQLPIAVREVNFNAARNQKIAERFKLAANMGWVKAYKDNFFADGEGSLLETELKFLTLKNGKIQKQDFGPCTTKDLSDCHDSQTEVLTENGWKLFKDVSMSEKVATTNGEGQLEWQYPTDRVDRPNRGGKMIKVRKHGADFCVTPGHRMLAKPFIRFEPIAGRTAWTYDFSRADSLSEGTTRIPVAPIPSVEPASPKRFIDLAPPMPEQLPNEKILADGRSLWTKDQEEFLRLNYHVMTMDQLVHACNKRNRTAIYNKARHMGLVRGQIGDRVLDRPTLLPVSRVEDFARFLGFWLGDGKKIKRYGYDVKITQTKESGKKYIRDMFTSLGWEWREDRGRNDRDTVFSVKYAGLREYLKELQIPGTHELKLPDDCFTEWSFEARRNLIDGLVASDGHRKANGKIGNITNTSSRLIDDIQTLLLTMGQTGTVNIGHRKGDQLNIPGEFTANYDCLIFVPMEASTIKISPEDVQVIDYDGMVHCLTVPNGTLVTRRNGRTLVAGNCVMEVTGRLLEQQLAKVNQEGLSSMPVPGMKGGLPRTNLREGVGDPSSLANRNRDALSSYYGRDRGVSNIAGRSGRFRKR